MLLDTSGLLCLLHKDQPQHLPAQEIYSSTKELFTHNYVLDELVAVAIPAGYRGRLLLISADNC